MASGISLIVIIATKMVGATVGMGYMVWGPSRHFARSASFTCIFVVFQRDRHGSWLQLPEGSTHLPAKQGDPPLCTLRDI